jgi:hypothetical protein
MNYKVKRQTDVGSKNWGVYLNDKLIEGGFFCKEAAEKVADEYNDIGDGTMTNPKSCK